MISTIIGREENSTWPRLMWETIVHFVECKWPIPTALWENTLQRKREQIRYRKWSQGSETSKCPSSCQCDDTWEGRHVPAQMPLQAGKCVDSFVSWDFFLSVYERHFVNNLSRIMMYLWNYATRHEVIHLKRSGPRPELHDSHHVLQIVFIIGQMPSNPSSLPPYPCHCQINTTNSARDGKSLCKHLDSLADRQVDTGPGHESLSNKVLTCRKSRVFWLSRWKSLLCCDFLGELIPTTPISQECIPKAMFFITIPGLIFRLAFREWSAVTSVPHGLEAALLRLGYSLWLNTTVKQDSILPSTGALGPLPSLFPN